MNTLYILTTNQCQLNCSFCYCNFIPDMELNKSNSHIDPKKMIKLIHVGYDGKPFDYVIFHGGEPLLYPDIINEIIDGCEDTNTKFSVQTNLVYNKLTSSQLKVLSRTGYGTSYNKDRFDGKIQMEKNFIYNIRELNRFGINGTLIVTITEKQINEQNPWALKKYIEKNLVGIDYIMLERPIFPNELIKKDKEKYKKLYRDVDHYIAQCVGIFDKDKLNWFDVMGYALKHTQPIYNNHCSRFTYTVDNDKFKFGCPSLENINEKNSIYHTECLSCKYYRYCKGDCECFNHVCAFPKETFEKISVILKEEKKK